MSPARKFKREAAQDRKDALIAAALSIVAEKGIADANVRDIAKRAEVTQGLIRHYFSSKEELLTAAYAHHMDQLTALTDKAEDTPSRSPIARLAGFVRAGLRPPVATPRSVSLWAGFLTMVRNDPRMKAIHLDTYKDFRNRLEALIGEVLQENGTCPPPAELRRLAIASNAVIDGLWMEGGALPELFDPGELPEIGVASVGAIIGVNLKETGQKNEIRIDH